MSCVVCRGVWNLYQMLNVVCRGVRRVVCRVKACQTADKVCRVSCVVGRCVSCRCACIVNFILCDVASGEA